MSEGTDMTDRPAEGYQDRVAAAHHALFHDDPTDVPERLARFMEEVNETCQAFGMTREDAHRLVDYTYDRPAGEPAKEIGAAMLTLTSLCVVAGYDLMTCAEADLEKLQRPETIDRIRAKRSTRHGRGPLPGFDASRIRSCLLDKPEAGEEPAPGMIEYHLPLRRADTEDYAEIFDRHGEKVALTVRPDLIMALNALSLSPLSAELDRLRRELEEVRKALKALVEHHDAFEASSGNFEEAYYKLAKYARPSWEEARAALRAGEEGK